MLMRLTSALEKTGRARFDAPTTIIISAVSRATSWERGMLVWLLAIEWLGVMAILARAHRWRCGLRLMWVLLVLARTGVGGIAMRSRNTSGIWSACGSRSTPRTSWLPVLQVGERLGTGWDDASNPRSAAVQKTFFGGIGKGWHLGHAWWCVLPAITWSFTQCRHRASLRLRPMIGWPRERHRWSRWGRAGGFVG